MNETAIICWRILRVTEQAFGRNSGNFTNRETTGILSTLAKIMTAIKILTVCHALKRR